MGESRVCNKRENSANEKCYKVLGAKVFVFVLFFKKSWVLLENAAHHKRCCLPWVSGDFQHLSETPCTVHSGFWLKAASRSFQLTPHTLLRAAKLSPWANCRVPMFPSCPATSWESLSPRCSTNTHFFKLWILQRTRKCTTFFFSYNDVRFCKTLG